MSQNSPVHVLIVDDEKNIRRSIQMICDGEGYQTRCVASGEDALRCLQSWPADMVLLDINMPGMDGLEVLEAIGERHPTIDVIIVSGFATIDKAVQATKKGAWDFVEKPVSKEKLLLTLKNAVRQRALAQENARLRERITGKARMVGESDSMRQLRDEISRVAPTDGRVLILGESGTGKELIAQAIHENSPRHNKPFIKINCAAIPAELIESELFGSEKGAFTGAITTREGKFSLADGGTLFLDEVGDMSLPVQAKVLRVLQEGEFEKVGGQQTEKVDVRVVAATNKDLEQAAMAGEFREDLYFRLNVVPILSPPLRERRTDIPLLIDYFLELYCAEHELRRITISQAAKDALMDYEWPGNIRELRNTIERVVIMARGTEVGLDELPRHLQKSGTPAPVKIKSGLTLKGLREQVERDYIAQVLAECGGNISAAARELGIDRTNLHKKIRQYGLQTE